MSKQAEESLFDEVIRKAGGLAALAKVLDESVQTISNWRSRGFPANRCKAIELITAVSVRRLRPNDWGDYWPDLIGAESVAADAKAS